MPVDVARFVASRLNGGDDDLMMRALAVRELPAYGPRSWFADRFGLLGSMLVTPLRRAASSAKRLASSHVAYEPSRSEAFREHRRAFARIHFDDTIDFLGRDQLRSSPKTGSWLRWYWLGVAAGLLSLADFSARRYRWIASLMLDVQAYARCTPGIERVYCFALFDRRPYLLATWLARHTDIEVLPVFQNIPLYRNCRFMHLEIPVVLTSKVNLEEAEHYRAEGLFRATEFRYVSQEFPADFEQLAPSEPVYDVGYFSSGEWARKGGLYQSEDVEAIRRGEYLNSTYARQAEDIVEWLAEYCERHGNTLRIYPHPFERRLRAEHGIEPPYATLVDAAAVSIDWAGGNSRSKIYESRAAVSLQSSFIWERLDLGLDSSFIFEFPDAEMNAFSRPALGAYAANVFASKDELYAALDQTAAAD